MTSDEAIKVLEDGKWWDDYSYYRPETKDSDKAKDDLLDAIDIAIAALRAQEEAKSPCAACGYGGKHLDAPPCTECPAHPKVAEKNDPLTLDELRQMMGQPVWCEDGSGNSSWCLVSDLYSNNDCVSSIDGDTGVWSGAFYGMTGHGKHGLHEIGWLAYRHPLTVGGEDKNV